MKNCWLQLWDIRGGHCIQTFTGHESDINSIVVSSNAMYVAASLTTCSL